MGVSSKDFRLIASESSGGWEGTCIDVGAMGSHIWQFGQKSQRKLVFGEREKKHMSPEQWTLEAEFVTKL